MSMRQFMRPERGCARPHRAVVGQSRHEATRLDQAKAPTVSGDHALQQQIFQWPKSAYSKDLFVVRRLLIEGAARALDKRDL